MALAEILEKPPRELRLFLSFSYFFVTLFGVSLYMAGPHVEEGASLCSLAPSLPAAPHRGDAFSFTAVLRLK